MEETENYDDFVNGLVEENQGLSSRNNQYVSALSSAGIINRDNQNLAIWQVDEANLLERIEHYLRGDKTYIDEKGNTGYKKQKNKELILLNDFGVSGIMEILSRYIDKGLSLSYFTDEARINEIIADIGDEIADYFLCNYDKMGMDTPFKRSKFKILVLTTLHNIEFTARKAIKAKQMEEINTGRIITQQEGINHFNGQVSQFRQRGIFSKVKGFFS